MKTSKNKVFGLSNAKHLKHRNQRFRLFEKLKIFLNLQKMREERKNVENKINNRIKKISEMVNSYFEEGNAIEIISNHQYKLQITNGDILIIKDTGSVFLKI